MTDRTRLSLYEAPGRAYGWRAWIAWHLLRIGCRHPVGMVCKHRHYEYDFELRGSHSGYTSGVLHERGQRAQPNAPAEVRSYANTVRSMKPVYYSTDDPAIAPAEGLDTKNAPVIDDRDENATPEMRRVWEAAIRAAHRRADR